MGGWINILENNYKNIVLYVCNYLEIIKQNTNKMVEGPNKDIKLLISSSLSCCILCCQNPILTQLNSLQLSLRLGKELDRAKDENEETENIGGSNTSIKDYITN